MVCCDALLCCDISRKLVKVNLIIIGSAVNAKIRDQSHMEH